MVMVNGQMGIYLQDENDLILGIDPGRDKTGFAFVNSNGDLICSGIVNAEDREKFFDALTKQYDISNFVVEGEYKKLFCSVKFIALGNGTKSQEFHEYLKNKLKSKCEIKLIDERNTTLEARKLYWKIHKPKFLEKLLPENMRVPKRILDDLAAWAIALRALKE